MILDLLFFLGLQQHSQLKIASIAPKKNLNKKTSRFVTLAIRNKAVSKPSLKIEKTLKGKRAKPEPAIAFFDRIFYFFSITSTCFANQKIT